MEKAREVLEYALTAELIQMHFSNSRDCNRAAKAKIRPVSVKGELKFQETLYRGTQVFHSNYSADEMLERLLAYLKDLFCQAQIQCEKDTFHILVSRKGTVTVKRKKVEKAQQSATNERDLSHNRTKNYILEDGVVADFLVGLGVQTPDGKITKARYDKFRQINRFLEYLRDVVDVLPSGRPIRIVDFGCGKSYLTFAMYYYLHQLLGKDIRVVGLDLKMDVIERCNALARQLHYDNLHFEHGDIQNYTGADQVDVVVSLHACDKATDYALEKAVKWGAQIILAVPCCQHELNGQISCEMLAPLLKYGVLKERVAALLTDAIRANLLEQQGYQTQILEFIDMEHTPKNLLIRAVKKGGMRPAGKVTQIDDMMQFLHVEPTLKELL
jgi:SAM-dependent methyltransferase